MPATKKEPRDDILVTLRVPRSVHAKLTKEAKRDDMTLAAIIRRALRLHESRLTG